nr:hypothetical protein CFP56_38363 [Quercus suber]
MAYTRRKNNTNNFILSFDINDEIFREIRLPENNLDDGVIPIGYSQDFRLAVFKGSLALIASDIGQVEDFQVTYKCVIWVMRRYGVVVVVVESWTKKTVAVKPGGPGQKFLGCTDSGQLLFFHISGRIVSYDPESGSQNEGNIGIPHPYWMGYTTDFMESLLISWRAWFYLISADMEPERNPGAATGTPNCYSLWFFPKCQLLPLALSRKTCSCWTPEERAKVPVKGYHDAAVCSNLSILAMVAIRQDSEMRLCPKENRQVGRSRDSIQDIQLLAMSFERCLFNWIPREANVAAN